MKFLFIAAFFFTGLGLFLLVASAYEHIRLAGGIPSITRAEELHGRSGERVKIDAELAYTNIYMRYSERTRGQRGSTTRTWYLHIIQFEDTAVAFRSVHSDVHTRGNIYGMVEAAPINSIYARLLRQYSISNAEMFPYAIRFHNINTGSELLTGGLIVLPIGVFFSIIFLLAKKGRKNKS